MALYQTHGITVIDRISLLNIGTQGMFGIGIYWATSNAVTVLQTLALSGLLWRRRRALVG